MLKHQSEKTLKNTFTHLTAEWRTLTNEEILNSPVKKRIETLRDAAVFMVEIFVSVAIKYAVFLFELTLVSQSQKREPTSDKN